MIDDKKYILGGIDFSITSPAMALMEWNGEDEFFDIRKDVKFWSYVNFKVKNNYFENVREQSFDWKSFSERWDKITEYFVRQIDVLASNTNKVVHIGIEGYAYMAGGKITQLAELTGLLKHKLYKRNYKYKIFQPTQVKQFICGNGTAQKERVYKGMCDFFDIDFSKIVNVPVNKAPIFDLSDAGSIQLMVFVDHLLKKNNLSKDTLQRFEYMLQYMKKENKQGISLFDENYV